MGLLKKMNPLLRKVMASVEATVKPADKDAYTRIVTAGLKFAFDKKSHSTVTEGLDKSENKIEDAGKGAVGLVLMLRQQSGNTMPIAPMVQAGAVLLFHALDYCEQALGVKIGNAEIDTAYEVFLDTIRPKIGLDDEMLDKATSSANQAMANPEFMAKFNQSMGGK